MSTSTATKQSALDLIDSRPLTRNQKNLVALAIVGNISEFFDIFLIGFVVSVLTKPWNLTGTEAGVILACSGLGTVIGAIMWGRLADKIGRRSSFFWCVLLFVVFTVVSVFTPDRGWIMLAILRIGVGIGVGGLNITSIPYVQEFVPAKQRGLLAGLASVFIPLGLFLGSLAQNALGDNWRALIALGAIPVFLLVWIRFVPESPRFLQSHGREKEAREALAWALDMSADEIGDLPVVEHVEDASYSLVFGKYRKSLLVVSLGSFCFILGSFTIQSWGQTLLKTGFGKSPEQVGTLFMFVSLADLLVAMAFADGAFGILNAFGAEQFPNEARSTGLGLGYGIGATAKIIGPALMGLMVGGSAVKQNVTLDAVFPAFVLFTVLLVIGGVTYMFARETRGTSLDTI